MNKLKGKLAAIALGIFVVLAVLEAGLRIIGSFHSTPLLAQDFRKNNNNDYMVLCVGDSFTRGVGASPDKSYPSQLQELLDRNFNGRTFKVVNMGMGAYNSSMLLDLFRRNLGKAKPDLVIILTGSANTWNSLGYMRYKNNSVFSAGEEFLYSFKVFKLVKLLAMDTNKVFRKNFKIKDEKAFNRYLFDGVNLVNQRRNSEALEYLNKAKDLDPDNSELCLALAFISEDNREAVKWFEKAIALEPMSTVLYSQLVSHCMVKADPELKNEIMAFMRKYEKVNPEIKDILAMISDRQKYFNDLSCWLKHDLEQMLALCRKSRIPVIFQNYPLKEPEFKEYRIVNLTLEETASQYGVPFVDNFRVFELLPKESRIKDYFALDIHCNARGYGLMAENVFKKIKEENLVFGRKGRENI
ncbi:MAG: GDSL-type esterase/lipase family protein [Candidatus Omnitrophica bacterium]|nr:GDSL-type esterase/lipase family protein [Candidatus Omnitrophota bacterium]